VLSGLALLYSIAIAVYPPIRETVLKRLFKFRAPGGVTTIVAKTQVSLFYVSFLNPCTCFYHGCFQDFAIIFAGDMHMWTEVSKT
jgi:hypothetical protein